jgi:MFS family permease
MLRSRPVVALLVAEVVSVTGAQMTWLALPWYVLVTTGSATKMSVVVGAELLGVAAFGVPGAKVLGRLGARRTMMLCDGVRGPLMLVIPVLHWADALSFGVVVAVAAGLGALGAPYFTAQRVIVPELLGEDEAVISKANALFQGATRATMLLGPVLGGLLIAFISAPAVLLVDAATYVVAFALVAVFLPRRARLPEPGEPTGIRAGLRFLVREKVLRVWTPIFALGDTAWTAFFVSVPVLVVVEFDADPKIAGWLIASFGIGAVVGNFVAYRVVLPRMDGMTTIAAFAMGQALPLWLLSFGFPWWVYGGALVVSGVANGLVNPSLHTLMTLRIPPTLRPTVMTAMTMVFVLVQPLGVFGAGPVLDEFGPRPVLVAFAAVQTVAMALVVVVSLRARAPAAATTASALPAGSPLP